jgi:hypothetical protein
LVIGHGPAIAIEQVAALAEQAAGMIERMAEEDEAGATYAKAPGLEEGGWQRTRRSALSSRKLSGIRVEESIAGPS